MTGSKEAFSKLDGGVTGSVKFSNGSKVEIRGRSTIIFLRIINIIQWDECGCKVLVNSGMLRIQD